MKNSCLWLAHPFYSDSIANKEIIKTICAQHSVLPIRNIDTLYPDYKIDVATEQKILLESDLIILQFPIFWYSTPASMKNWIDNTLSYNFAYGPEGNKLKDKELVISITAGAEENSYSHSGKNAHSMREYLLLFPQIATLANMNYKGIIASYGLKIGIDAETIKQKAKDHATQILQIL